MRVVEPHNRSDVWEPDEMVTLESNIFEALGAVSACWEHLGRTGELKGEFQSERATVIGNRLRDYVKGILDVEQRKGDIDRQRLLNETDILRSEADALREQIHALKEATTDDAKLIQLQREEVDRLQRHLHAIKEIQDEYMQTLDGIVNASNGDQVERDQVGRDQEILQEASWERNSDELLHECRAERDEWQRMALAACQSVLDVLKSRYAEAMRSSGFPHHETGGITVLGPETFIDQSCDVICYKGVNYYRPRGES